MSPEPPALTTDDLERATRPVASASPDTFDLAVPDGWQQGRGAYGGLTIAALVRAIETYAASPDRTVRALNIELPAPVMVGNARIHVETLRAGTAQSTLAARITQGDELCGQCVAILGRARARGAGDFVELEKPTLRAWQEMTPLPAVLPGAPTFLQHYELRTDGPFPLSGGREARALGWVRPRTAAAMSGAAYLAAVSDVFWPAAYTRAQAAYPAATVTFSLQVFGVPELGAPLMFRSHAYAQFEGYSVEQRELWSEAGELLALNQQTLVVIK